MNENGSARRSSAFLWFGVVAAILLVPTLIGGLMFLGGYYAGEVAFGPNASPAPIPNVADWPQPLQDLHAVLQEQSAGDFEAYLLSGTPGVHSVDSAVFRIKATERVLKTAIVRLQLATVKDDHRFVVGFGRTVIQEASEDWWVSTSSGDVTYYASQRMLDGEEGDLYVAAYDKGAETLYVYYWFNF